MQVQKEIKSVSDIKKNPDMRIEFTPPHHQDFISFKAICDAYKIQPANLARHLALIFTRKFNGAPADFKNTLISEVIQSIHGIAQVELFSGPAQWGNIEFPTKAESMDADRRAKIKNGKDIIKALDRAYKTTKPPAKRAVKKRLVKK